LTFVIKFLPILKGISLIHVYSQNKLSRNTEENTIPGNKQYKEMDIIYGGEIKNSSDIEFRYTDPKKLKEVEKFFIEFYLGNRINNDLFYENNHELKYFNYNIISIIQEVVSGYKNLSFEGVLTRINTKLREIYITMSEADKFKYPEFDNGTLSDDENVHKKNMNNSDLNNLNTNFLNIKKEFIIREIFKEDKNMRTENGLISRNNDNTLYLSKLSDNEMLNNDYSLQFSKQLSNISYVQDDTLNMLSYNTGYNSAFEDIATKGIDNDLSHISKFRNAPVNVSIRSPAVKEPIVTDPLVKLQQSLNKDERLRSFSNTDNKNTKNNNSLRDNPYIINKLGSPQKKHNRANSFLVNKYYVKVSNNAPRDVKRHSAYQDINTAYKKLADTKLTNIYYNIANNEADNKEVIPGCVSDKNSEEKDIKDYFKEDKELSSSYKDLCMNNHSFAPKTSNLKDEQI
jgi:hypothetical protein